jgi:hypothetical protein
MLVLPEPVTPYRSLVVLETDLIFFMAVNWELLSAIFGSWWPVMFPMGGLMELLRFLSIPMGRRRDAHVGSGER